jgi:hypothetical protein
MVARLGDVHPQLVGRVLAQSAQTASRTKCFDESFIAAGFTKVRQHFAFVVVAA